MTIAKRRRIGTQARLACNRIARQRPYAKIKKIEDKQKPSDKSDQGKGPKAQ